jgi:DtxR family Mn-dependent transcriptional regulator
MQSSTEEDYLKAIYKLIIGNKAVSTNSIANLLKTKPSSVTDMVKKLAEKNLVNYIKYKGVSLSAKGEKIALTVIRKHRLWESFLVNKLNFKWDEIHEIAEQLEHIDSLELVDKLDEHLNFPTHDPHGDPIPNKNGDFSKNNHVILSDLEVGKMAVIKGVREHSSEFLQYLESIPLLLGTNIKIIKNYAFDSSMKIEIDGSRELMISSSVGNNLNVSLLST